MYDPDPRSPVLRLGDAPAKPVTVEDHVKCVTSADMLLQQAEAQMEDAIKRWVEATMHWQAARLQSQPIPASASIRQTDAQHLARYRASGSRPLVFRADGKVEALG